MKKTFLASAFALSFVSIAQNGAQIEFKITSSKGVTGSCTVKCAPDWGSKVAMDMNMPQVPGGIHTLSLIKQDNPDVIYTINENAKTYSEIKKSADKEDKHAYTVKKIGEEKINGYNCIHAMVTTEGTETSEVWNTKDLPEYNKYAGAVSSNKNMGSPKREQALKDAGCDGLPVKVVHKGNVQEGDVTMELVKMDKKTFARSDFDLPSGYTKSGGAFAPASGVKTQQEIMSMTPEERARYIEEMKKQYGKKE